MLVVGIILVAALGASLFTVRLKPDATTATPSGRTTPDVRGVRLQPDQVAQPDRANFVEREPPIDRRVSSPP